MKPVTINEAIQLIINNHFADEDNILRKGKTLIIHEMDAAMVQNTLSMTGSQGMFYEKEQTLRLSGFSCSL